jgi:hypothetical protein
MLRYPTEVTECTSVTERNRADSGHSTSTSLLPPPPPPPPPSGHELLGRQLNR